MNKLIAIAVLAILPAFAQETIRTVELKHTVHQQYGALGAFGINWNGMGNYIVLRGQTESVKAAEAFIAKFDVPRKSIEAVLHVLAASPQATAGEKLPAELEPVIKQLRNNFVYQGFKLLETVVLRSREGGGGQAGGALPTTADPRRTYHVQFREVSISDADKGHVIRFDRFSFSTRSIDPTASKLNNKIEYTGANLMADIDVREGQRVVVGKANLKAATARSSSSSLRKSWSNPYFNGSANT